MELKNTQTETLNTEQKESVTKLLKPLYKFFKFFIEYTISSLKKINTTGSTMLAKGYIPRTL